MACFIAMRFFPQMALDRTMEKMIRENTIKARFLDVKLFPHGQEYFEVSVYAMNRKTNFLQNKYILWIFKLKLKLIEPIK